MTSDILPTVLGIILVAAAAAFALLPFARGPRVVETEAAEAVSPASDRFAIYRQVIELEFDYELGKLTAADYEAQSAELLSSAGAALRAERGVVGEVDAEIEREILAARAALSAARKSSAPKNAKQPEAAPVAEVQPRS
jgi:hypothetical protein